MNKYNPKQVWLFFISFLFALHSPFIFAETFMIAAPSDAKSFPRIEQLMIDVYQNLGFEVQIVGMPAQRALVESGKNTWVDAELARVPAAEKLLPDFIRVPAPLFSMEISSYSLSNGIEVSSWQSLKGLRVVTL